MSTATVATLALTTRMVGGEAKPLSAKEYWPLARRIDLGSLPGSDAGTLAHGAGLTVAEGERVARLLDRATAVALAVEGLEQSGIWTLTPDQAPYPHILVDRLGDAAPPVLHGVGPVELLTSPGLALVGSRDVTPEGADVARAAARVAVGAGWSVISGAARGVDQQSMDAAYEAGGCVVGVLADSLSRTIRKSDVRRAVLDGSTVLMTPYAPETGFSAGNAMGRNKIIYALAKRALVVCSDLESGGTWAGAVEALRAGWLDVCVWRGPGEGLGNTALETRGARPLTNIDSAADAVDVPVPPRTHADQLSLDV